MITTFQAIFLGLIQGLTEFLPISSSAHLILVPYFFHWNDPGLTFDVALHMGTLSAILLVFWKDWLVIVQDFFKFILRKSEHYKSEIQWTKLVIGCLPAAIIGGAFGKQIEAHLRSPILTSATLSIFGIILLLADRRGSKSKGLDSVSIKDSLLIGCAQALALIPGVSRSGVTITAALLLGLRRQASMRFSFLLAAPITAGAGIMKLKHISSDLFTTQESMQATMAGFTTSLASGMIAIIFLNKMLKSKSFAGFTYYRIVLSLVIIVIFINR